MKNCPRTIDRPITLLGFEMEDFVLIIVWLGVVNLIAGGPIALLTTIAITIFLKIVKRGKPRGFLRHILYHWGVPFGKVLPPPKRLKRYAPFPPTTKVVGMENIFVETEK